MWLLFFGSFSIAQSLPKISTSSSVFTRTTQKVQVLGFMTVWRLPSTSVQTSSAQPPPHCGIKRKNPHFKTSSLTSPEGPLTIPSPIGQFFWIASPSTSRPLTMASTMASAMDLERPVFFLSSDVSLTTRLTLVSLWSYLKLNLSATRNARGSISSLVLNKKFLGVSLSGRAPVLGTGFRGFDSLHSDQYDKVPQNVRISTLNS